MAGSDGLIYFAWDSLYTGYLYDMMYKDQACRMCKEKNDDTRLRPSQIDNRIKQLMSTVKTKPQTSTNNEQIPTPARYRGYKTQRASFLRQLAVDIVDQFCIVHSDRLNQLLRCGSQRYYRKKSVILLKFYPVKKVC